MTEDDQDLLERIEALVANAWDDDEHETLIEARDRIEALSAEKEAARKEERKAILSFIEEIVDWDGVDYEKLTNWIEERGL